MAQYTKVNWTDGLQIKHCYWTHTKAKQWFINFSWKIEFDAKTAGLLFRLNELDCWWLITDSNLEAWIINLELRTFLV